MDNLVEEFIANGDLAQLRVKIEVLVDRFKADEQFQALCLLMLELKTNGVPESDIINAIAVATVLDAQVKEKGNVEFKVDETD